MSNAQLRNTARQRFIADFDGREPLAVGVTDGVCWLTVVSLVVGVNGYAMIPAEGHPWSSGFPFEDEWDADEVFPDVHGGVTYCSHPWIGFDTAHAWDWWPPEYDKLNMCSRFLLQDGCIKWTPSLVAYEARKLAIAVAKIGFEAKQAAEALTLPEPGRFQNLDVRNTHIGREK